MQSIYRLLSGIALLVVAGCSGSSTTQPTSAKETAPANSAFTPDKKAKKESKGQSAGDSGPVMTMHRVQAGTPDEKGWCVAESRNGGFVVELPGLFNDFSQTAKTTSGVVSTISTVGMITPGGIKYSTTAIPRHDDKIVSFDNLANGFGRDLKGRKPITHGTLAGEQFTVGDTRRYAVFRYLKSDSALYLLGVEKEMGSSFSPAEERDANFFLDSFRLSPNGRK